MYASAVSGVLKIASKESTFYCKQRYTELRWKNCVAAMKKKRLDNNMIRERHQCRRLIKNSDQIQIRDSNAVKEEEVDRATNKLN